MSMGLYARVLHEFIVIFEGQSDLTLSFLRQRPFVNEQKMKKS